MCEEKKDGNREISRAKWNITYPLRWRRKEKSLVHDKKDLAVSRYARRLCLRTLV